MRRTIENATPDDLAIVLEIRPPEVAVNARTGLPYPVPPDWQERVALGEEVIGVSAYDLVDEIDNTDPDNPVPTGRKLLHVEADDIAILNDEAELGRRGINITKARAARGRLRAAAAKAR